MMSSTFHRASRRARAASIIVCAVAGLLLAAAPAAAQSASPPAARKAPQAAPPRAFQVQLRNGPRAGTYATPADNTVCTRGGSQAGRWDIQTSDAKGDLMLQLSADLPSQGGSTGALVATLAVGVMNVQTGDNPPDGINTLAGQRSGSGTLTIRRAGQSAVVTLEGRTAGGIQLLATLRCGHLIQLGG